MYPRASILASLGKLPTHANLWLLLQKFQDLSEDFEINITQDNFGGQRFAFQKFHFKYKENIKIFLF